MSLSSISKISSARTLKSTLIYYPPILLLNSSFRNKFLSITELKYNKYYPVQNFTTRSYSTEQIGSEPSSKNSNNSEQNDKKQNNENYLKKFAYAFVATFVAGSAFAGLYHYGVFPDDSYFKTHLVNIASNLQNFFAKYSSKYLADIVEKYTNKIIPTRQLVDQLSNVATDYSSSLEAKTQAVRALAALCLDELEDSILEQKLLSLFLDLSSSPHSQIRQYAFLGVSRLLKAEKNEQSSIQALKHGILKPLLATIRQNSGMLDEEIFTLLYRILNTYWNNFVSYRT